MAFRIEGKDISQELQDKCWIHARGEGPSQRWSISEIINAAIEAGLVSPPCCCGRLQSLDNRAFGPVLKLDTGEPILWAPGSKPINVVLEHWRGQTE